LKNELRANFDKEPEFFHGIVLSANKSPDDISAIEGQLEPAFSGKKLAKKIDIQTDGCLTHRHYFFARYPTGLYALSRKLYKLDEWMSDVPKGLLPDLWIPTIGDDAIYRLLRWMSLLYYLAWRYDEIYWGAEIEYQETLGNSPFNRWPDCPQPQSCDPRPWLIHQEDDGGRITGWRVRFNLAGLRFPDVISAYLVRDVLFSSIAAIDTLIYRAADELTDQNQPLATREEKKRKHESTNKTRYSRSEKEAADLIMLTTALRMHHLDRGNGPVHEPITQIALAKLLKWSQSQVSRRMEQLFPYGGMGQYKELCQQRRITGFVRRLKDGSTQADGIVEDSDL
jgi:hypothetical protein